MATTRRQKRFMITVPLTHAQRTQLCEQGQRMSNWLYNVAQFKETPAWMAEEAKQLVESWDAIKKLRRAREGR